MQNRDLWHAAQYDQPKDDIASDDENLLEYENFEVENELNEIEAADGGGIAAVAGSGSGAPAAAKAADAKK